MPATPRLPLTSRPRRDRSASGRGRFATATLLVSLALSAVVTAAAPAGSATAAGVPDHDWLGIVNAYRSQSGLAPVVNNASWSAGALNHSCWMLLNGIAHDEAPGTPGYTAAGDEAGNSGNVAVTSDPSATPRDHIDLWMSGPFHAIGVLRSSLTSTGFGLCSSPPNPSNTPWKSGGTLDVVRGNNWGAPKPSQPIVFPGPGSTTSLDRFIAESPDPRSFCGWNGRSVGLPLIALMPGNVTAANATITGPSGPVGTCVLHKSNTSGVAQSILGGDNAVVVVPATKLAPGTYTVNVSSNGGVANWSFTVDPDAPLVPAGQSTAESTEAIGPSGSFESITPFRFADSRRGQGLTRLPARVQRRIQVAGVAGLPSDITAVSANFTVVNPNGAGFLTAYSCSAGAPSVSTLNYRAGETAPNQALVPLDDGALCLYANRSTDVVIDVNGYVSPAGASKFVPVTPTRLLDTRTSRALVKGNGLRVVVAGGSSPAPLRADAVALNITAASPMGNGWVRAYPCDAPEPAVSSLNPRYGVNRPNSALVPVAADGSICLTASVTTHVVIDITGWFGPDDSYRFTPLDPVRLADTRSYDAALNPFQNGQLLPAGRTLKVKVAGVRGVPNSAKAATINVVAVSAQGAGWVKVVPCGTTSSISTLNFSSPSAIANGSNVKLAADGSICVTSNRTTHILVDITGVWS